MHNRSTGESLETEYVTWDSSQSLAGLLANQNNQEEKNEGNKLSEHTDVVKTMKYTPKKTSGESLVSSPFTTTGEKQWKIQL